MTERVPDQIARRIAGAFAAWHTEFRGMTRRARGRFARREWQGGQEDAEEDEQVEERQAA